MRKIKKKLNDVYENKLIDTERYYVDLLIYYLLVLFFKFLNFLNWIFKHEKLTIIFTLILTGLTLYILLYVAGYFLLGFNFFMEKIGLEEVIEFEKKIYHLYINSK